MKNTIQPDKTTEITYFRIGDTEFRSSSINGSDDIKYETGKLKNFYWRSCSKSVFEKAYEMWKEIEK